VIAIVVSRVLVAVMLVLVLADVKVEVEEACAKLAVTVPIAGGVYAETADADDHSQRKDRAGQPGTSDYSSPKTSHLRSPR